MSLHNLKTIVIINSIQKIGFSGCGTLKRVFIDLFKLLKNNNIKILLTFLLLKSFPVASVLASTSIQFYYSYFRYIIGLRRKFPEGNS